MKKLYFVRTIILAGSLLLQLNTLCFQSRGAAGDVDLSFDPGSGVNGPVNAVAVQPDGKVIIGGEFTTVKGLARTRVARLNADGSGDSSFNRGTGDNYTIVRSISLQPDGKVLIGHDYGIERLHSDGSLDTNFNASVYDFYEYGVTPVNSIVLGPDGKVLIAGFFSTVSATNLNFGIARLNSNGSVDNSFNADARISTLATVYSLALQADGKVLAGGNFTYGTNGSGIVRLDADGSLDTTFNPGTGTGASEVLSVVAQSDGKVLIGGSYIYINGTNRNRIARLNANGSLDGSFNPGTGVTGSDYFRVNSVAVQSDGKVLIGGFFSTVNGTNRNGIARLNADGSLDSSFNPGTGVNIWQSVYSIALQSDGRVLIGGSFTAVNGTNRNRMARLNADGSLDGSFHPGTGLDSSVSSLVVQPDGKVLIGDVFTFINGTNRYGSARLNADGGLDSTFISNTNFHLDLTGRITYDDCMWLCSCAKSTIPTVVVVQADGKVLIGGQSVTTITCDPEGGGQIARHFLARFNADASLDTSFEPVIGNPSDFETVSALAVQPDGKVIVGGTFNSIKGTNRNGIARLNANGSLDNSFDPGTGANWIKSVALQSDGKVLLGGYFGTVNGTNRNGIARLNANGSLDGSFNPGTGAGSYVLSVAVQPDGKVLIGGFFTTVNGTNRNNMARLNANGSLDGSFNPGTGADGLVRSITLQSDGKVLIGGDFTTVNGVVRPYVARLYGDSVAPSLSIARSNGFVIVSWPVTALNFQLQENTDLSLPNSWSPVAQAAVTNAGQISVTVPTTAGRKFFRLKSQ